eukprot:COSAG06_NODE_9546_length_1874_cov_1.593239_3_plen_225_part_00
MPAPAALRLRRVVGHLAPAQSTLVLAAGSGSSQTIAESGHSGLVTLFQSFRRFQQAILGADEPDFAARAIAAQYAALGQYQRQLAALSSDLSSWPVPEQVDYHLVRAEMNGLEFRHRVMKPWLKDPGFYVDVIPRVRLDDAALPLDAAAVERAEQRLGAVRAIVSQAVHNMENISAVAADLGTLAIYRLEEYQQGFESARHGVAAHHLELLPALDDALVRKTPF